MTYLGLGINYLSGSVPPELFQMGNTGMDGFAIFRNTLTGTFPPIWHWSNLTEAWLDQNLFTGTVPTEIGLLTKLSGLAFSGNYDLSGTIPEEIGSLVSDYNLSVVFIENTGVSGVIPEELCTLNSDPNCTVLFPFGPFPCILRYNCTEELCGCDDCDCFDDNSTLTNMTAPWG